MRHNVEFRKLGRTGAHRTALLRNLVVSLILHDRIETTLPRAKELRRVADRVVTLGKSGSLAARRQAAVWVPDALALSKLFSGLADRYRERRGGYTRIVRLGNRHGDAAPMAMIEYVPAELVAAPAKTATKKPKSATKKPAKKAA